MGCKIERCGGIGNATNTKCVGLEHGNKAGNIRSEETKTRRERSELANDFEANGCDATNTNSNGFNERNGNNEVNTSQRGEYALGDINTSNVNGNATDTKSNGSSIGKLGESQTKQQVQTRSDIDGFESVGDVTDTTSTRGRKDNRIGKPRFNDQKSSPNNWNNFPTQSPVCGGDDGIPTELDGITFSKWRAESIKGYGNAIVPQIAYQLFQIINEL